MSALRRLLDGLRTDTNTADGPAIVFWVERALRDDLDALYADETRAVEYLESVLAPAPQTEKDRLLAVFEKRAGTYFQSSAGKAAWREAIALLKGSKL